MTSFDPVRHPALTFLIVREIAMKHTWLRKPAVLGKLDIRTTKLYQLIRDAGFPSPVKLGHASLWSEEEIDAWMAAQAAKRGAGRDGRWQ